MEYKTVPSICPYCGCGCGILLEVVEGKIVGTLPLKTHPINKGKLCIKGWNVHEFVYSENRLTSPKIKKDGKLKEVDWDEAISYAAKKLLEIKEKYGPNSIALISSARCSNEENFLMMKLARSVLETNNIDHCARLCHSSTVVGLIKTFGSGAMSNPIPHLEGAKTILIFGSNTTEAHPIVATYIFRAKDKGANIIVIDPRKTHIARIATKHLPIKIGTDIVLVNGMINEIIKNGWEDKEFIENFTEGYEELKKIVSKYDLSYVAKVTGIDEKEIYETAYLYAHEKPSSIVYCLGITQHHYGTDNVISLANLSMLTGNVGKPFTGVNPLRGQNNVQGACDMGCLPGYLSGYQKVSDDKAREEFEKFWGKSLPKEGGLTVEEMFAEALKGNIKAMIIQGENPLISNPNINRVRKALKNLEFLVVLDIFSNEMTEMADVVFACASFLEKEGTFTNTDRRVQYFPKVIEPIPNTKPDWQVISLLAYALGSKGFSYNSPEEIFNEMSLLTPIYRGISYERLKKNPLQWPCKTRLDPGCEYLHKDGFTQGKGKFIPVEKKEPFEIPDEEFPFILTTGRTIFHYHTATMTKNSPSLNKELSSVYIEINPEDAKRLNVEEGEKVKVISRRGEIEIEVRITDNVSPGLVYIPMHFSESPVNVLTSHEPLDPQSKIPPYKYSCVNIKKIK